VIFLATFQLSDHDWCKQGHTCPCDARCRRNELTAICSIRSVLGASRLVLLVVPEVRVLVVLVALLSRCCASQV